MFSSVIIALKAGGRFLTIPDLCILLLSLLHILGVKTMPADLYSPTALQPSMIVCKVWVVCDNGHGTSFLNVVGMLLAWMLQDRLQSISRVLLCSFIWAM